MAKRYDFKLDETGDLVIQDDDVLWAESDKQHIQDTINAAPGWYKENPADGVNVRSYLKSSGMQQVLSREITTQLTSDQYEVQNPEVIITADKISINPNATI